MIRRDPPNWANPSDLPTENRCGNESRFHEKPPNQRLPTRWQLTSQTAPNTRQHRVLEKLFDAQQMAVRQGRPIWDFAVEFDELTPFGTTVLRELTCGGLISHQREITTESDQTRTFEHEGQLVFSQRSCFVITGIGVHWVLQLRQQNKSKSTNGSQSFANGNRNQDLNRAGHESMYDQRPIWDTERRELRIGGEVIKKFKWPATNQEAVLQAFQEEGWPSRIDDPLVPDPEICPKRRLHDTIKCLNRRRINKSIKFRGDGTGTGVLIEINISNE